MSYFNIVTRFHCPVTLLVEQISLEYISFWLDHFSNENTQETSSRILKINQRPSKHETLNHRSFNVGTRGRWLNIKPTIPQCLVVSECKVILSDKHNYLRQNY